jgi:aryl-alcohol dehydrogenase-like predicted oxidoreductase
VRWIGASSTLPHLATFVQREVFDTFQIPYSALQREHEEVISTAAQAGMGVIIRGGVARGAPDEAGQGKQDLWETWAKAKLDELRASGESQTAFLLRFTLSHPHMHTTIVGTMNPDHLAENLHAAKAGPLSPDVYAETKRRLAGFGEKPTGS